MSKSIGSAAPFAFAAVVVLFVGAAVWFVDTPVHDASEFSKDSHPAIGASYVVRIPYLGVPDRADIDAIIPPQEYLYPDSIRRMVDRGTIVRLQAGDRITLREVWPSTDAKDETVHHARIETPHGDLWVMLANVTYDVKSEPVPGR